MQSFNPIESLKRMKIEDLNLVLETMCPYKVIEVNGVYARTHGLENDPEDQIKRALQQFNDSDHMLKRFEQDYNRRFIVANIVDDILDEFPYSEIEKETETLRLMANIYASLLRDYLVQVFPDVDFIVEIVGDDGLDDEPLELYVTFYQANTAT